MSDSFLKRTIGLLGRKGLKPGAAMILKPCNSIHTLFMRFSIDVLFVGKDSRVIKAVSAIKPFRLTRLYYNADFAVELAAGVIQATSTSTADLLSIE